MIMHNKIFARLDIDLIQKIDIGGTQVKLGSKIVITHIKEVILHNNDWLKFFSLPAPAIPKP